MLIKININKIPGGQKTYRPIEINLKIEFFKAKIQQTQMKF